MQSSEASMIQKVINTHDQMAKMVNRSKVSQSTDAKQRGLMTAAGTNIDASFPSVEKRSKDMRTMVTMSPSKYQQEEDEIRLKIPLITQPSQPFFVRTQKKDSQDVKGLAIDHVTLKFEEAVSKYGPIKQKLDIHPLKRKSLRSQNCSITERAFDIEDVESIFKKKVNELRSSYEKPRGRFSVKHNHQFD